MLDVVDFTQFLLEISLILAAFQRADGKGGGKIVICPLPASFASFFHAEAVAFEAALPPSNCLPEAFCHLEEFLWVVSTSIQFDRVFKFHGVYKTGNFMDSFAMLLLPGRCLGCNRIL